MLLRHDADHLQRAEGESALCRAILFRGLLQSGGLATNGKYMELGKTTAAAHHELECLISQNMVKVNMYSILT